VRGADPADTLPDWSGRGRPAEIDRYFDAVDQLGSPADTSAAILRRSEAVRRSVDSLLVQALGVGVEADARADCPVVEPAGGSLELTVREERVAIRGTGTDPMAASVRRYADTPAPDRTFSLPPNGATLSLPAAGFAPPWRVRLEPVNGPIRVCGASPS
jgi:hypothetical protein